ncbi:MAG: hypothetical protein ABJA71_17250 [Ginsengibacter sp.]
MKKYFFMLCAITAVLVSCSTSKKANVAKENALFNQWLHHPRSQLINQWGQPDSTVSDGENGEILIYKERVDYISVMDGNYTGPQYSFRKEMFVNADSLIYNWKAWRRK